MVSALDSGSNGQGLSPDWVPYVVFRGKALHSSCLSLSLGWKMRHRLHGCGFQSTRFHDIETA